MTEQEKKERLGLLERKKKGYEQNRNISVIVICLLTYDTWKTYKESSPEWYFYLIMGIMVLVLAGIIFRDYMEIKKISEAIKTAQAEQTVDENTVH